MKPGEIIAALIGVVLGLVILWIIIMDTPIVYALGLSARPEVTESPSWWHWKDEQEPREEMIHYLTYEEVQHEAQP